MSEIARAAPVRKESGVPAALSLRITLTWETAAYAAILVSAFGMRFWDLGSRALHHDESLHAFFANQLFTGGGYEHTPLLHGPLQIFGTALAFFVAGGAGDAAARALPALLGTALVGLPLLLRGHLGRIGAVATAGLLAFSPALLYFSRFARNDIWIAFFTLALVACIWRYVSEQRPRYLYWIAALLALSFATKENAFIVVATFALFLDLCVASDLAGQTVKRLGEPERHRPFYTLAYVPFAWLVVALWPFIPGLRRRFGLEERLPATDLLLVIGTLSGPQFAAAIELPLEALGVSIEGAAEHRMLGIPTVVALIAASAAVGLRWNPRVWAGCAALFYVPYTLLFTAFLTDISGFGSGMWESLDYWLGQHEARRAGQPDFYYLMFMPAYELLALAFAGPALLYYALRGGLRSVALTGVAVVSLLAFFGADSFEPGGAIEAIAAAGLPVAAIATFFAVRGTPLVRFLVFWAAASIVAYSYFGEKFPWLFVHMALPIAVLGGYTIGRAFEGWSANRSRRPKPRRSKGRAKRSAPPAASGLLKKQRDVLHSFLRYLRMSGKNAVFRRPAGSYIETARRWALPVAAGAIMLPLLAFALWTGLRVTYVHGDEARELLIYTQTTSDVPEIADGIHRLAARSGLREDLRIHVDRAYSWPWAWYLREYDVTFDFITLEFEPEPGAVVIMSAANDAQMTVYRENYEPARPFTLREWFLEDYRGVGDEPNLAAGIGGFVSDLFNGDTWENWWDFMVRRDLPSTGSTGFVYIPSEFDELDVGPRPPDDGGPQPTGRPVPDLEGRLIIGSPGEEPGQMRGPIGLALDGDGNPVVVDNGNDRIQHFSARGDVLGLAGSSGMEPGQFTQPSDVAVDLEGNIWVADTWNHRVQKLAPDLTPLLSFGEPTNDLINPGDDKLWGPRGIAVDREGNILFTDTGTHRVRKIAPDGTFIATFGSRGNGPSEFEEPVGIAAGSDGSIYVADAGNARIQKFDAEYNFVAEFPIESWASRDPRNKPHLAVLPDGRLLATDSLNGRLLLIDSEGTVADSIGAVAEIPLFFPAGVAYDAASDFVWVSDSAAGHIRRFPLSDFALR